MLKKLIHTAIMGLLGVSYLAHSAPKQLITHNLTNFESNAFIDGTIPSVYPSKANSDNRVFWASVKLACYGRISNNICHALIKMKSNTPTPVDLGWVSLNLSTGEILPALIVANGYRMTVNGPGETTIEALN